MLLPNTKCITKTISVIIKACLFAFSAILLTQANPTQASTAFVGGCQCTDYAYSQRTEIPRGMGNARDWISSAARRGYSYDQVPQVGDVAVFLNGSHGFSAAYGHVAMVTWVNDSHTQYNISGWDGLKADCVLQSISNLTVRADDWFIHQGGAPSPPPAPPSSPQPSSGGIEFSPVSPVRVGETVNITVKVQPGSDFRSARLLIDYQVVSESAATEFSYSWNTSRFLPSVHNIRLEIATRDDTNWAQPYSYEATYLLRESVQAQNRSPNTPSPISPANGQTFTENGQLCWHNNGDPDGDPVKTRAEVWGAGLWVSPWLEGDDPCWTLPGTVGGEYSWAVRARDSKGAESAASAPWGFTMQPTAIADPVAIAEIRDECLVFLNNIMIFDMKQGSEFCFSGGEISYSPTGEYFLVLVGLFEGDNDGFVFQADGSNMRQMTSPVDFINYSQYEWTPDGKYIIYQSIYSCCVEPPAGVPAIKTVKYDVYNGQKEIIGTPSPEVVFYRVVNVASNDVLNIRAGAGVNYDIAGTIPPDGQGIQIIGDSVKVGNSTWVPIIYNGISGWVNSNYLIQQ